MFSLLNTEGYTEQQLAEMNRRLAALIEEEEAAANRRLDPGDITDKSTIDHLSEQVLREFDNAAS